MAEDNELTTEDMQATDLGMSKVLDELPPEPAPRRQSTRVKPEEVHGGKPPKRGRPTNAARQEKAKVDDNKARAALVENISKAIDAQINPALAQLSRAALGVPPQMAWVEVEREDGQVVVDNRGVPKWHYYNGAELTILSPFEIQIMCMVGPLAMEPAAIEKGKELAKKAMPLLIALGGIGFAASYAMRLRQAKAVVAPQVMAIRRQLEMEAELQRNQQDMRQNQGGNDG